MGDKALAIRIQDRQKRVLLKLLEDESLDARVRLEASDQLNQIRDGKKNGNPRPGKKDKDFLSGLLGK